MASALLLRGLPLRYTTYRSVTASAAAVIAASLSRRHFSGPSDDHSVEAVRQPPEAPTRSLTDIWIQQPDFRKWKEKEAEMLKDIQPIMLLAKEIIHSNRYVDGAILDKEDEKIIIEKLLAYHPHYEKKIGCGLEAIMVDTHPEFPNSRCLFVVRTDGCWVDFSYQKCLVAYLRQKYPSDAERFIKEHFKRSLL